jgi:hypothetical protein
MSIGRESDFYGTEVEKIEEDIPDANPTSSDSESDISSHVIEVTNSVEKVEFVIKDEPFPSKKGMRPLSQLKNEIMNLNVSIDSGLTSQKSVRKHKRKSSIES